MRENGIKKFLAQPLSEIELQKNLAQPLRVIEFLYTIIYNLYIVLFYNDKKEVFVAHSGAITRLDLCRNPFTGRLRFWR